MKARRRFLEADASVAELVRLYCFLRQTTVKAFVTHTLKAALAPSLPWIESVKALRSEGSPDNTDPPVSRSDE